jgi:hypothetical protein
MHCLLSHTVTGEKPFACLGAPLQGVAHLLQICCSICARELHVSQQQLYPPSWLQYRALMRHSANLATCTKWAMALLETTLKRCGGTSLLPPKTFSCIVQSC